MRILLLTCITLIFSTGLNASKIGSKKASTPSIRVVPVEPTPEPDNVRTTITFPKEGQILNSNPVQLQLQLVGFPIGTTSDFDRKNEIFDDSNGQSLLIFIDDYHPIEIYKSFVDSLDSNNLFFSLTLTASIPFYLKDGMHVIRAFPDRSFGESLKAPGNYAVGVFYMGREKNNLDVDLNGPYLTYNEPLETIRYCPNKPVLLDFYLSNVQLSTDGYKVKITIDEKTNRLLTQWTPYYIYGLKSGKHTVRLQLVDGNGAVVPGIFNDVKRTITVR